MRKGRDFRFTFKRWLIFTPITVIGAIFFLEFFRLTVCCRVTFYTTPLAIPEVPAGQSLFAGRFYALTATKSCSFRSAATTDSNSIIDEFDFGGPNGKVRVEARFATRMPTPHGTRDGFSLPNPVRETKIKIANDFAKATEITDEFLLKQEEIPNRVNQGGQVFRESSGKGEFIRLYGPRCYVDLHGDTDTIEANIRTMVVY